MRVCVEDVSVLSTWVCDRGPERILVKFSQSHTGDFDFVTSPVWDCVYIKRDLEIPYIYKINTKSTRSNAILKSHVGLRYFTVGRRFFHRESIGHPVRLCVQECKREGERQGEGEGEDNS